MHRFISLLLRSANYGAGSNSCLVGETSSRAQTLERWLARLLDDFGDSVLVFDADVAQVWGRLRVPHPENPLDKQIAATALIHHLVLVTRNVKHFSATGVKLFNPFRQ